MITADQSLGIGQKCAREIMGDSFFGLEDIKQCFSLTFTDKKRGKFVRVPFSKETLLETKDTHILFPYCSLSLVDIYSRLHGSSLYSFDEDPWYIREEFAKTGREPGWRLIRKRIVPDSTGKTFDEQLSLLDKNEVVPFACELVYMIILLFETRGTRLFRKEYANCQDFFPLNGRHIHAGIFPPSWLDIRYYFKRPNADNVGLASARISLDFAQ